MCVLKFRVGLGFFFIMIEYVLLIWIGEFLYFQDIYSNLYTCKSNAELILNKQNQYSYICSPNTPKTQKMNVKGVFHKDLLKKK